MTTPKLILECSSCSEYEKYMPVFQYIKKHKLMPDINFCIECCPCCEYYK